MTTLVEPPGRLLTVTEYAELGEDDRSRWELPEGNLVISPSPSPDHMLALYSLCGQLTAQLPDAVVVVPDVDIDLQLDRGDQPGTSRRPDLVVVNQAAVQRVRAEGGLLRACRQSDEPCVSGYVDDGAVVDTYVTDVPYPVTIDLAAISNLLT